jgi:flagellar hook assembly protein FlgD
MRGRHVRVLVDEEKEPGSYAAVWDGRGDSGEPVPAGVYFYRMESADFMSARKMVLWK